MAALFVRTATFRLTPRLTPTRFSSAQRRWQHDGFASLNIYKDASAAPKELPDNEYPEWLWRIQETQPTKEELLRVVEQEYEHGGYDAVFENVDEAMLKRLFRLHQKDVIKEENARRKGGNVV